LQNELGFVLDLKTLAIQLHGTLLTRTTFLRSFPLYFCWVTFSVAEVNAGPLAVAKIFIAPETRSNFDGEHVQTLQAAFVKFVQLLADALTKQKPLIDSVQLAVQNELERQYFVFKAEVCRLTGANPEQFSEGFGEPSSIGDDANPSMLISAPSMKDNNSGSKLSPASSVVVTSNPRRLSQAPAPSNIFTTTKTEKK